MYRFFSDLDQPNVMDRKPFFEFNMLNFTEPQVEELKRFTKSAFSMSEVVDAASGAPLHERDQAGIDRRDH